MADSFDPNFVQWQGWPNHAGHTEMQGYVKVNPDGLHIEPMDDYYGGCIDKATAIKLAKAILEAYEGRKRIRIKHRGGGGSVTIEVKEETEEAWLGRPAGQDKTLCGLWPKAAWKKER